MGASASNDYGSANEQSNAIPGFKVTYVWKGSPAHEAGVEVFFDHIIGVDDVNFLTLPGSLSTKDVANIMERSIGKCIKCTLYNNRQKIFRVWDYVSLHTIWSDLWVTPRRWSSNDCLGVFGATLRSVSSIFLPATALRVLEVMPHSLAAAASLLPGGVDYILGAPGVQFSNSNDLLDAFATAQRTEEPLRLCVYNVVQERTRYITIPTAEVDTAGLGISVGTGLLHQLPPPAATIHSTHKMRPRLVQGTGTALTSSTSSNSNDSGSISEDLTQADPTHLVEPLSFQDLLRLEEAGTPYHLEPKPNGIGLNEKRDRFSYDLGAGASPHSASPMPSSADWAAIDWQINSAAIASPRSCRAMAYKMCDPPTLSFVNTLDNGPFPKDHFPRPGRIYAVAGTKSENHDW